MRWIATTVLLGALAVSGCGQDTNRDEVRTVATRFFTAITRHDGRVACGQLSADTVKALEEDEQRRCDAAIDAAGLTPARITHVAVYVTNAKVDLANGASAFLEQTTTGWKLSALGCRPTEGDPQQHPLACAVES